MSKPRLIGFGAVAALLALLLLARGSLLPRASDDPGLASPPSSSPPRQDRPPTPSAAKAADDEQSLPEELPPDHDWGIPAPTAAWMTATANPLVVQPQLDERRTSEKQITAGGGLVEVSGDRARFTLYVPPGAVTMNREVTLTAVRSVGGTPFAGGGLSAVQVSPANLVFLKPVSLTIEPRRRSSKDPAPAVAGFAIDRRGEWHLYPAIVSTTPINRFFQDRQQLVVTRGGIYGVADATEDEVRAAGERVPSDFMARIDVGLANLIRTGTPAPAAAWSLFPVVHAQSDDPERREFIARLVQQLRDIYDQQLMPKLQRFRADCHVTEVLASRELHGEAVNWIHAVQIMGLTAPDDAAQPDAELDHIRETMPLTFSILERERAENDAYYGPIIEEFAKRQAGLWDRVWTIFRDMYAAILQCCKTKPHTWMPAEIIALAKVGEMTGRSDILGGGWMQDAADCGCAVNAVFNRQGWEGTITHKYTASGARTDTRGTRTSTASRTINYVSSMVLMGTDDKDSPVAYASAHGEEESSAKDVDASGVCSVHQKGVTESSSGAAVTMVNVTIDFYKNHYRIGYSAPVAFGMSRTYNFYKAAGCANPFANREDNDWTVGSAGITGGGNAYPEGDTENQLVLSGSKTLDLPADYLLQRQQVVVQWDLRACQAK